MYKYTFILYVYLYVYLYIYIHIICILYYTNMHNVPKSQAGALLKLGKVCPTIFLQPQKPTETPRHPMIRMDGQLHITGKGGSQDCQVPSG